MLSYSGYPDDAVAFANAYLIRRSGQAIAGAADGWDVLKPGKALDELQEVKNGWQLDQWARTNLDCRQTTKLQAAIRQARRRAKLQAEQKPVSVSLDRDAVAMLDAAAKRDGVTRSQALADALSARSRATMPGKGCSDDLDRLAIAAAQMVLSGISYELVAAFWNLCGITPVSDSPKWAGLSVKALIDERGAVARVIDRTP